jgi:ABC-2 type transport system permease protein
METPGNYFVTFLSLALRTMPIVLILAAAVIPLRFMRPSAFAVIKRNFKGYFSNPTGYVFLCVFVLLTSLAAFWPHGFFNANLANLDQLNDYLPMIMLIYIPAITMGVWSEERRDGTDELLLTLPAKDFDIVIGKYLAATLVFTVSLLFSQISNFLMLASLATDARGAVHLDVGLLATNYFGYWMIGLAMLAIGMVASFLTSNPTIAFVFGLAFNAPLALLDRIDVIVADATQAQGIAAWGIAAHFEDFRRGVVSLSSISYFAMLITIGLYISMVMIGRRHWVSGTRGPTMGIHFLARALLMIVIAASAAITFQHNDFIRADMTMGKISSLSSRSLDLIGGLDTEDDIVIRAYIGEEVPKAYVRTRLELISMLREFAASSSKIRLQIFDKLQPFSKEIEVAEQRYGIRPQTVRVRENEKMTDQDVILGAAFQCGLQQVVVPFFDYGIPVEYELARSISTVAENQRRTIGVISTDARIEGGFIMTGQQPQNIPRQALFTELEKQYDIETVTLSEEIDPKQYSMLLAVQPSSLSPEQLPVLLRAIEAGVPTAIFEDPVPEFMGWVPGTRQPKPSPGGIPGMGGMGGPGSAPKCDIDQLWDLLELEIPHQEKDPGTREDPRMLMMSSMGGLDGPQPVVAWQNDNPYPILELQGIPKAWVFVPSSSLNPKHIISSGLKEIFFPVPGTIRYKNTGRLTFTPLASTTKDSGAMRSSNYQLARQTGDEQAMVIAQGKIENTSQTLAALIESRVADDTDDGEKDEQGAGDEKDGKRPIKVIYVADIDLMSSPIFGIRARPDEFQDITWQFENVTFLLNIIDELAGEDRFIEIRKRRPRHSTLVAVAAQTEDERKKEYEESRKLREAQDEAITNYKNETEEEDQLTTKAIIELEDQLDILRDPTNTEGVDVAAIRTLQIKIQLKQLRQRTRQVERARGLTIEQEQIQADTDRQIGQIQIESQKKIDVIHKQYKLTAVILPPILPLLIGMFVFFVRRVREREGVAISRLR